MCQFELWIEPQIINKVDIDIDIDIDMDGGHVLVLQKDIFNNFEEILTVPKLK